MSDFNSLNDFSLTNSQFYVDNVKQSHQDDFSNIDYYYNHDFHSKYTEFNKFLDENPDFDPNGSSEVYPYMWAIHVVMGECIDKSDLKYCNTVELWSERMELMSNLVIRLENEFHAEININVIINLLNNRNKWLNIMGFGEVSHCSLTQHLYHNINNISKIYANNILKIEAFREFFNSIKNNDDNINCFENNIHIYLIYVVNEYQDENLSNYTPEQWAYRTSLIISLLQDMFYDKKHYRLYNDYNVSSTVYQLILNRNIKTIEYGLIDNIENEELYLFMKKMNECTGYRLKRKNDVDDEFISQRSKLN